MPNATPYSEFETILEIATGAVAATALVTVKSAKHQIFVTEGLVHVVTHADGKELTLQSSNGTPVKKWERIDDAEGDGQDITEVQPFSVAVGESLNYVANTGGTGSIWRLHLKGYQKLVGPVTIAQAASGG
jgi:hypothetical protein